METPFFFVAIQRQVRAFSLEGRSSKPLHSNDHDEESNSSSQDPQSSIFEKDFKPEPPNRTRQTNGSTWVRARLLGHNQNLGLSPIPLYFKNFHNCGMQGASEMAPRVGVSTILLGPGFSLWLSSWNQWLEGPTMYQNGSGDCVWMDECRTSRSDESPANIYLGLFFGEKISLTCPWLKPMPNSFLPMQRKNIKILKLLTYASFSFYLGGAIRTLDRI